MIRVKTEIPVLNKLLVSSLPVGRMDAAPAEGDTTCLLHDLSLLGELGRRSIALFAHARFVNLTSGLTTLLTAFPFHRARKMLPCTKEN